MHDGFVDSDRIRGVISFIFFAPLFKLQWTVPMDSSFLTRSDTYLPFLSLHTVSFTIGYIPYCISCEILSLHAFHYGPTCYAK